MKTHKFSQTILLNSKLADSILYTWKDSTCSLKQNIESCSGGSGAGWPIHSGAKLGQAKCKQKEARLGHGLAAGLHESLREHGHER